LKYFHEKANGIFLWAVVILHQLKQTKSTSVFRKYLQGFSDSSGDMERLYSSVFSRIEGEDRNWIRETLKWVVIAKRELTVDELKEAVEQSLKDQLPEFHTFLEVEAGSMLNLVPGRVMYKHTPCTNVELIHETLRSFLLDPECCPEFFVNNDVAHGQALNECLSVLSSTVLADNFKRYAAENWTSHLSEVGMSKQQPVNVLSWLHQFFKGEGARAGSDSAIFY
jgi:hypothetical protein